MASGKRQAGAGVPFDTSRAHMARLYDFWLGGRTIMRPTGPLPRRSRPRPRMGLRSARTGVPRPDGAVLVAEAGIRQFLDIGTGLPCANNAHEVAQRMAPESRVVYVDNDPVVAATPGRC